MSKEAINLTPAVNKSRLLSRDLIWMAIRELREFNLLEIEQHARLPGEKKGIPEGTIKDYLQGLRLSGYIEYTVAPARYTKARWQLIKDIGVERPYVQKNGKPAKSTCSQTQIWRTLKMMNGLFDKHDLKHMSSTDEHEVTIRDAGFYLRWLARSGYLISKSKGTCRVSTKYQVVKSRVAGPKPPMVLSTHQVFNPNTGEIWTEEYKETE